MLGLNISLSIFGTFGMRKWMTFIRLCSDLEKFGIWGTFPLWVISGNRLFLDSTRVITLSHSLFKSLWLLISAAKNDQSVALAICIYVIKVRARQNVIFCRKRDSNFFLAFDRSAMSSKPSNSFSDWWISPRLTNGFWGTQDTVSKMPVELDYW